MKLTSISRGYEVRGLIFRESSDKRKACFFNRSKQNFFVLRLYWRLKNNSTRQPEQSVSFWWEFFFWPVNGAYKRFWYKEIMCTIMPLIFILKFFIGVIWHVNWITKTAANHFDVFYIFNFAFLFLIIRFLKMDRSDFFLTKIIVILSS